MHLQLYSIPLEHVIILVFVCCKLGLLHPLFVLFINFACNL